MFVFSSLIKHLEQFEFLQNRLLDFFIHGYLKNSNLGKVNNNSLMDKVYSGIGNIQCALQTRC